MSRVSVIFVPPGLPGGLRNRAAGAWRAWVAAASLLVVSTAQACGAEGGDERPSVSPLVCDPDAGSAVHAGIDPPAATRNPVDLITGNKYLRQRDAVWAGGLSLVRHYNSRNDFESALGPGWRHGYEVRLAVRGGGEGRRVQIIQGDGRRIVFDAAGPGVQAAGGFRALVPGYGQVFERSDAPPDRRFVWHWRDGSRFWFDLQGRLSVLERADGRRLRFRYETDLPCRLSRVENAVGAALRFRYHGDSCRVSQVTGPDGRRIRYDYDSLGLLRQVTVRGEARWHFEYHDAHRSAIVRMRDGSGVLRGEFAYDAQGRAVASSVAGGESVRLRFRLPSEPGGIGETWARDDAGRESHYRWRYDPRTQRRQLLSATGERCAVCPEVGWRWRYDDHERLTRVEHVASGAVRELGHDTLGRVVTVKRRRGGRVRHWWFTYDPDAAVDRLVRIDTDSVAPGRRHSLRLRYDRLQRLIEVQESGWAPVVSSLGRDVQGALRFARYQTLSRTRAVRYGIRGGAAGRVVAITLDGRELERYGYDPQGALARVERGGLVWRFARDATGRLTGIERPDGSRWRAQWDDEWVTLTDRGVTTRIGLDSLGRPETVLPGNAPGLRFERRADGTVSGLATTEGHRLLLASVGREAGRPGLLPSAPGERAQAQRAERAQARIVSAAGLVTLERPELGDRSWRVVDDFGRQIARLDPATGVQRWHYDAADRIVARAGPLTGGAVRFVRDAAGRVIRIEDPAARPTLAFDFSGGRLTAVSGPHQQERFGYDEAVRLRERELHLHDPVSGQQAGPIRLGRTYDKQGRLSLRTLHDGYALAYRWRGDNTLAGIDLVHPGGARSILVDDCRWLPFTGGAHGLLAARFGNGSRVTRRIDALGRTLAVRHVAGTGGGEVVPTEIRELDARGRTVALRVGDRVRRLHYDARGYLVRVDGQRWSHRADGTPVRGGAGAPLRTWTDAAGHVRVALDRRGRPVRYLRNAAGQRIAKLWPGRPDQTRWFVYDEGRQPSLVLDAKGRLRRIFVVLDHLPLAVIDIDPARPGARISWVHADYRGLPRAVTDARGHTVWQGEYGPYGRLLRARTRSGPVSDAPVPWRLPGQYADPETGLTLNDLRTFDPVRASYLTPDPLGLRPTGLRMAYAENRPYDRADPLGLYEIDIHYYMTYFIARTAGIEHESAYRIALAAQGIDDNPLTQPINQTADGSPDYGRSLATNQDRLLAYHFVLSERVPGALFDTIETPSEVPLANPSSPQLDRLMAAVHSAGDPCAAAHLLGEFVHAFQDTYAHRDHTNRPYDPLVLFNSIGLGHGLHMHDPDWTFNHNTQVFSSWSFGPMGPAPTFTVSTPDGAPRMQYLNWTVNEARTLQMERDLHARLLRFGNPDDAVPFEMIEPALREFNAIHEWQQHGKPDEESFPEKIGLLEEELRALGYGVDGEGVRFRPVQGEGEVNVLYDRMDARDSRTDVVCQSPLAEGVVDDICAR